MENNAEAEQKSLITELKQGRELAKQLQASLAVPSTPHEAREHLFRKILTSYENALSLLNFTPPAAGTSNAGGPHHGAAAAVPVSESPRSLSESPRSEDSDRDLKDQGDFKDPSRKRKVLPRWTQQVQVPPGSGVDGYLEDGFSWRKYGQKEILGAKYPRAYYRCTHRSVQGCSATKQVQRCNSTIFEVTYRGHHTCSHSSHAPLPPPETQDPTETRPEIHLMPPQSLPHQQEIILNFQTGLRVITDNFESDPYRLQTHPPPPPPTTTTTTHLAPTNAFTAAVLDAGFGSPFVPLAVSGSEFVPQAPTAGFGGSVPRPHHGSGSDLNDIIMATTSSSTNMNSTTVGLDYEFDPMDFDSMNFPFDSTSFFP